MREIKNSIHWGRDLYVKSLQVGSPAGDTCNSYKMPKKRFKLPTGRRAELERSTSPPRRFESSLGSDDTSTRESECSHEHSSLTSPISPVPGGVPRATLFDSLAAELRAKLNGNAPPLLLPPRDYDTVHRSKGNLAATELRRCQNQLIVGGPGKKGVSSHGSSGIRSDLAASLERQDEHSSSGKCDFLINYPLPPKCLWGRIISFINSFVGSFISIVSPIIGIRMSKMQGKCILFSNTPWAPWHSDTQKITRSSCHLERAMLHSQSQRFLLHSQDKTKMRKVHITQHLTSMESLSSQPINWNSGKDFFSPISKSKITRIGNKWMNSFKIKEFPLFAKKKLVQNSSNYQLIYTIFSKN